MTLEGPRGRAAATADRDDGRRWSLAAAAAVAAVRWWTSRSREVFSINPDEPGQLAIARFLGRGARWNMLDHSTWRPGFGALVAPLTVVVDDAVGVYRAALGVNALLGGVSCLLLAWLAVRLTGLPARTAALVALAVSLAPAVLLTTNWVWSESLVQTVSLCFLVAAIRFVDTASVRWGATMVAAAAAGFATHSRLLVLCALAAAVVVAAAVAGRLGRASAGALLASIVASVVAVEAASGWIVDRVWDEPSARNTAGSLLGRLGAGREILASAAGQVWYQLVASLGVAGIGAAVLVRRARSRQRPDWAARIVLATAAAVTALSIVFMADRWRPDQLVYGRYIDGVIGPVLVVGIAWLVTASTRATLRAIGAVAAAVIVSAIVVRGLAAAQLEAPDLVRAMVLGLSPFTAGAATIDVAGVTMTVLVLLGAIALVRVAGARRPGVVLAGVLIVVLGAGYARARPVVDSGAGAWRSARAVEEVDALLAPGEPVRVRTVPDDADPALASGAQRLRATLYRFHLPGHELVADDRAGVRHVFAPIDDAELAGRGARVVWRDPAVPMALWLDPAGP